jgi:hypothetical protein
VPRIHLPLADVVEAAQPEWVVLHGRPRAYESF